MYLFSNMYQAKPTKKGRCFGRARKEILFVFKSNKQPSSCGVPYCYIGLFTYRTG